MVFRPDTFGKYVLLKRIAIGGMAEVFRAKTYGAEGFEKTVAIKRMLPHLSSDSQFVNMFINEAKLAASLTHANIAQIYDFGCIENLYFLSMEYVFGKDLADLIRMLRDKGLGAPIELACHVIIETLNGLDYAHRKTDPFGNPLNLIHRDTSPHNLIISYEGEVKIVDFGIAKAKSTTIQTTGGVLKGKYSYMSPEQAHGMPLDHRSDIFSLGICFYELLTLSKMFQGTSDLSVLEKVRETDFIPPGQLNESIPKELEDLLLKALEKNPDDRWESAAQWREALEDFLFKSNLHYSTAWLSGFMREIFSDDITREMKELGEEDEIARRLKKKARKIARLQSVKETVEFPVDKGQGVDIQSEHTENRPPIREVSSGEFVLIDEDEQQDEDQEDLSLLDTAIAASPLGKGPRKRFGVDDGDSFLDSESTFSRSHPTVDDLPMADDVDDESMPTIELSRPNRGNENILPSVRRAGRLADSINYDEDVFEADDDEDEDSGISQVTTMDERNQSNPPAATEIDPDDEEDFSMVTIRDEKSSSSVLSRLLASKEASSPDKLDHTGEAVLDPVDFSDESSENRPPINVLKADNKYGFDDPHETTSQNDRKSISSFSLVLTMLIALGVGGLVALWQVSFGEKDTAATAGDGGYRPARMNKGSQAEKFVDAGPDAQSGVSEEKPPEVLPAHAFADGGTTTDRLSSKPPETHEPGTNKNTRDTTIAKTTPAGADSAEHPTRTPKNPSKATGINSSSGRGKRKINSRRIHRKRTSCPTKGYGTISVGVAAGWAFVFIDGKEIRTTPLPSHKIRAGRHKIELKRGRNKILKRWNTCVRRGRKVTLIYQNN